MRDLPVIARPVSLATEPWVGPLVVFLLVALLVSFAAQRKKYQALMINLFRDKKRIMTYDNETSSLVATIALWTSILVIYSFFAYTVSFSLLHTLLPLVSIPVIAIVLALTIMLRSLFQKLLGFTFNIQSQTSQFIATNNNLLAIFAVLLLPIATALIYAPQSARTAIQITALSLYVFYLLALLVKLLQIFYSSPLSIVYIFLYLCALELLPVVATAKMALTLTIGN